MVAWLVQGLGAAEIAGRLGTNESATSRRWALALHALLAGLTPPGARPLPALPPFAVARPPATAAS